MSSAKLFCALNDVVGHALAGSVDMSGRELLTESGGSARLNHIYHISLLCIGVVWIAAFKRALHRIASSVIIHDERIFPGSVEI